MRYLICCLLFSLFAGKLSAQQVPDKPNVIIIYIDDMGWGDVSYNNPQVDYTPNMSRIAKQGIRLTDFYVSEAVCTASRTSLMTGCYANRVGMGGAIDHKSKSGINPEETTLAEMLKANGYATAAFGKWHLGFQPLFLPTHQGFDEFYGIPYSNDMWPAHPETKNYYPPLPLYSNDTIIDTVKEQSWFTQTFTEKATSFITRNASHPFFLYLAHPMPHVPISVSAAYNGSTGKGLYADVIHELDASLGQILKSLSRNKIEEKTLVILASDNGPWLSYGNHAGTTNGLREGKGTSWEGGVRVPCVFYWKSVLPAGKIISDPLMTIDILPTIAAITGSQLPSRKIDGSNIWDILNGERRRQYDRPLFFYYNKDDLEAMRWKNWKLYFPHTYRTMNGQEPGRDGMPGKYRMVKMEHPELYDLSNDRNETKDVLKKNRKIYKAMRKMAKSMREELGDDLTGKKGKANRPAGNAETL